MPVIKLTVDQNLFNRITKAAEAMSLPAATWCKIQITESLPKNKTKDYQDGDRRKANGIDFVRHNGDWVHAAIYDRHIQTGEPLPEPEHGENLDLSDELEKINLNESPFKLLEKYIK